MLVFEEYLIVGTVEGVGGGPDIPSNLAALPLDRLRFVDGTIIDAASHDRFYIDEFGRKRLARVRDEWRPLDCSFADPLVQGKDGRWRIRDERNVLDHRKAEAVRHIDAAAEYARARFLTPGAGQAMNYLEKAAQAADCLASHDAAHPPAPGTYPLLDSEVGATVGTDGSPAPDAREVAVVVDAARTRWLRAEAAVNAARVRATVAVKAAHRHRKDRRRSERPRLAHVTQYFFNAD